MGFITLLTDFGLEDGYVGAMKGVILNIAPHAAVVDISHAVPAQDMRSAAWILYTAYRTFPEGTVHCVVVDPGVGSQRRAIGVRAGGYTFVAPDNGLLSYVLAREELHMAVELTNPRFHRHTVSYTFHGRDIFAPAAAHLAQGVPLAELGPSVEGLVTWPLPRPERRPDGSLVGHILHIDHFGNCITDLRLSSEEDALVLTNPPGERAGPLPIPRRKVCLKVKEKALSGISRTYADGSRGEVLALVGSSDHLEIALVDGSAAQALGLK
ncbi:MAG: SAM-dependent chlorinase/fluorinase, partial [Chloroflexota bacterium]|nr:SAM-dependent chlorinase/fluorinase [Chloroflexota bacterium]